MTETARRLERLSRPLARAQAAARLLVGVGIGLGLLGAGVAGVRAGWLGATALVVGTVWLGIGAVMAWAAWRARRAAAAESPTVLAARVERAGAARRGSVVGLAATPAAAVSAELVAAADVRAAALVARLAPAVLRHRRRLAGIRLAVGLCAALAGAAVLLAARPRSVRAAAFWRPWRAVLGLAEPVRLDVSAASVRRGESVTAAVTAPGVTRAMLWVRSPGEAWRLLPLALDSVGRATERLGPLEADLTLRAEAGGRESPTVTVRVLRPAFLGQLDLTARYPAYLERADEPIVTTGDTVPLPVGTVVEARGVASVPLGEAAWRIGGRAAPLRVAGSEFTGRAAVLASGVWTLELRAAQGLPLEGEPVRLAIRAIPDSAPLVDVPLPGRDTVANVSLRQPLVIDARDDHGLARLELVSRRVSRLGLAGPETREPLALGATTDRAVLQHELNLDNRGLLPGDTVRFRVEAWDNAPRPHIATSREYALRLPTLSELRAATREALSDVAGAADSVAAASRELLRRTEDAAAGRVREPDPARRDAAGNPATPPPEGPGALPYRAAERAAEIARDQTALGRRVEELRETLEEIARAAEAAGLNDPALQEQIRELEQLLQRALTPELAQRLEELRRALEQLDPEATREALRRLAEQQQWLRAELERSRELFRRAAVEGTLSSLAQEAEDLRRGQATWNETQQGLPDSAAAAREAALAAAAESLAADARAAGRDLARLRSDSAARALEGAAQRIDEAQAAMEGATQAARGGARAEAGRRGRRAAEVLDPLPELLRRQRAEIAQQWREETLEALDRTLAETAALAERQRRVAGALRRAEGGELRRELAAVDEGVRAVIQQVEAAGARHALISTQVAMALGYTRQQLEAARGQLEQAAADPRAAAEFADQAVDGLNVAAHALLRDRQNVAQASSGSGFAEAMEQLSRLAQQQGALNAQTGGMLDLMQAARAEVLAQLRRLAAEQRALAEQLERIQAQGGPSAAGELAREAREVARQLDAGRLDARTRERQERLFRRLLDAGRTLRGEEEDPREERRSQSATGDQVRVPPGRLDPAALRGPSYRYPAWEDLKGLTPAERQLVLDYFRRLNAPKPN